MLVVKARLFHLEWVWCPPLVTVVSSRLVLLGSSAKVVVRWILGSVVAARLLVFETCLESVIMGLFRTADQQLRSVETRFTRKSLVADCLASMGRAGFLSSLSTLSSSSRSLETRFTGFLSEVMLKILMAGCLRRSWCSRVNSHEVMQKLPMVIPSRAWVDEVKTLKQGDVYVGRGSKQRGLLPSFWANRCKVSKFGRDRSVELHRAEIQEDPQHGLNVPELSGVAAVPLQNEREVPLVESPRLFRDWHPHAFDPSSSERPPLSSELNILAKGREDREDSEESGLEGAEADAPQGWPGKSKHLVIGSGYVERRLFDGQGLCSPGAWAREDRQYPSSLLWTSISRLFLGTAESLSTVQFLSEQARSSREVTVRSRCCEAPEE